MDRDVRRDVSGVRPGRVVTVEAQWFVVYIACNMLLCSLVFLPWAKPRETISGILGRWRLTGFGWKQSFGYVVGSIVDRLYFWDVNHCETVYQMEEEARRALYP